MGNLITAVIVAITNVVITVYAVTLVCLFRHLTHLCQKTKTSILYNTDKYMIQSIY